MNLDDKIQKFFPDFPEYDVPITIKHLIHHTSGIRDIGILMYLKGKDYFGNYDIDEVYDLIKRQQELNFLPGEKHYYSNSGYYLLAMIIEKAAGQSLKLFAQKNIFEPLGMENTLFCDDNTDLIKNRVFSYEKKKDETGFDNLIMRYDLVGPSGMYSSIEDLYLWDQNFYNNKLGENGQAIIDKMLEEGILNNGENCGYAFALSIDTYNGLRTVSHGGSLAGYRAQLMRFPDQNFSVIILANRTDLYAKNLCHIVADIFLKDQFVEEVKEEISNVSKQADPEETVLFNLNQLVGDYEHQPGIITQLDIKNDSLYVVQSWNKFTYPIVKTFGNTFEIPGDTSVQFVFSELKDDFTQTLTVFQAGNEIVSKRKEIKDFSGINLEDYTGDFYSEELDATHSIFLKNGILKFKIAKFDSKGLFEIGELNISDVDLFYTMDDYIVRFNRSNGDVFGFNLDAESVTNLKFVKIKENK